MDNSKNRNMRVLLAVLVAAIILLSKNFIFSSFFGETDTEVDIASERVASIVDKLNTINFDLSIFDEPKFENFKDLDIPLPSIATGRENPFTSSLKK